MNNPPQRYTNRKLIAILTSMGVFAFAYAFVALLPVAHGKKMVFEPNRVEHIQYYPETDYRLDVYIITGDKKGPTALIVGGIQGDEEGGYLAADQFIDMGIEAGRLIVIPRANAKAVAIAERMTVVDMNRQFKDITYEEMRGAVETIKKYIAEADVFINFHDGWGFHRETYTNWSYSPDRFGQSVVTDSDEFTCSDDTIINLREPAFIAINGANDRIDLEKYYLTYFNTRTFEDTSKYYASMTNASTYYVLTAECKPAFAIEASKNLPTVKSKVLVHIYAAIPLLKYYGIVVKESVVPVVPPTLSRVVVDVDGVEFALLPSKTLNVTQGANITITNIYGNYKRGYTADIIGTGNTLDNSRTYKMDKTGKAMVNLYKDSVPVGRVFLQVQSAQVQSAQVQSAQVQPAQVQSAQAQKPTPKPREVVASEPSSTSLALASGVSGLYAEVNGVRRMFPLGQNIQLKKGDTFTPIDFVLASDATATRHSVGSINIKGFVPKSIGMVVNTGNDMGHQMIAGVSNMLTQYAVKPAAGDSFGAGEVYPVVVDYSTWRVDPSTGKPASPKVAKSELFYIQIMK